MRKQYKILAEQYNMVADAAKRKPAAVQIVVPDEVDGSKLPTDLKGFVDWIFTHSDYARPSMLEYVKASGYKDVLIDFYQARCEDFEEGEGLEWDEAEEAAANLMEELGQEYNTWLKAQAIYKQASKDTGGEWNMGGLSV